MNYTSIIIQKLYIFNLYVLKMSLVYMESHYISSLSIILQSLAIRLHAQCIASGSEVRSLLMHTSGLSDARSDGLEVRSSGL